MSKIKGTKRYQIWKSKIQQIKTKKMKGLRFLKMQEIFSMEKKDY